MFSYRLKRLKRGSLAKLALLFPKLNRLLATPTPLVTMEYPGGMHSKTLIIFLPGIDDLAEDFEKRGIIDDMRWQGIAADAIAVDVHYGYYAKEEMIERMTDDVIFSAHAAGYEDIWLAGISLGGFGSAMYASRHSSQIKGLLLLAPYLGNNAFLKEISDAGGITRWEPGKFIEQDYERALWAWLKSDIATDAPAMPIYLGYGTRDKFADANAMLAAALPKHRVFVLEGGHDWRTWKKIWQTFLGAWELHAR